VSPSTLASAYRAMMNGIPRMVGGRVSPPRRAGPQDLNSFSENVGQVARHLCFAKASPPNARASLWEQGVAEARGVKWSQVAVPRIGPRTNLHPPRASGGNMYSQRAHLTSGLGAGR
jgi:hypothetical protein